MCILLIIIIIKVDGTLHFLVGYPWVKQQPITFWDWSGFWSQIRVLDNFYFIFLNFRPVQESGTFRNRNHFFFNFNFWALEEICTLMSAFLVTCVFVSIKLSMCRCINCCVLRLQMIVRSCHLKMQSNKKPMLVRRLQKKLILQMKRFDLLNNQTINNNTHYHFNGHFLGLRGLPVISQMSRYMLSNQT